MHFDPEIFMDNFWASPMDRAWDQVVGTVGVSIWIFLGIEGSCRHFRSREIQQRRRPRNRHRVHWHSVHLPAGLVLLPVMAKITSPGFAFFDLGIALQDHRACQKPRLHEEPLSNVENLLDSLLRNLLGAAGTSVLIITINIPTRWRVERADGKVCFNGRYG